MKITEKLLLDGYVGITYGHMYISEVDGICYLWNYVRGENGDGYNPVRKFQDESEEIFVWDLCLHIPVTERGGYANTLATMYKDFDNALLHVL